MFISKHVLLFIKLLLIIFCLGACDNQTHQSALQSLAVLGKAPQFELHTQHGKTFTQHDLVGKTTLLYFMFTSCPTTCPLLNAAVHKVEGTFLSQPDTQIVAISIDPEMDSPSVLKKYAAKLGVHSTRFHMLTGQAAHIRDVANQGFKVAVGDKIHADTQAQGSYDISHSTHVILLDKQARIRTYLGTQDKDFETRLSHALRRMH